MYTILNGICSYIKMCHSLKSSNVMNVFTSAHGRLTLRNIWWYIKTHPRLKCSNVLSVITNARWRITSQNICWCIKINHRLKYSNAMNVIIRASGNAAICWYIIIHHRLKSSNVINVITEGGLKVHMLVHKSLSDVKIFKYNQCDYITKRKSDVQRHLRRHHLSKWWHLFWIVTVSVSGLSNCLKKWFCSAMKLISGSMGMLTKLLLVPVIIPC